MHLQYHLRRIPVLKDSNDVLVQHLFAIGIALHVLSNNPQSYY